jgi:hypothetical protein
MFWKRIFGKPKPEEPTLERLSIDKLRERVEKLKLDEMGRFQQVLQEPFKRFAQIKEQLMGEIRELSRSEGSAEIHPGLYKSALEARRLLVEKLTRLLSEFTPRGATSLGELSAMKESLARLVNLTTQAVSTHGRYTRAAFAKHMKSIGISLSELHRVAREIVGIIDNTAERVRAIDRLSSKVNSLLALRTEIGKTVDNIEGQRSKASELEKVVGAKRLELSQFLESDDFKRVQELSERIKKVEDEVATLRRTTEGKISGLNRTLRKFEKMVTSGKQKLTKEQRVILKLLIQDPTSLLSTREKAEAAQSFLAFIFPLLELGEIERDERERAKRLETFRGILEENLLSACQRKIEELERQRGELLSSWEKLPHLRRGELQQAVKDAEADLARSKAEMGAAEEKLKSMRKEFERKKPEVEEQASEVLGSRVELTS